MVNYYDLTVLGFPGYRIGSNGSVWTLHKGRGRGGLLDAWKKMTGRNYKGYKRAVFVIGNRRIKRFIHRLVLLAFVGPCPEGMQSCHRNGKRDDNRLENLRWGTPQSNSDDKRAHGTVCRGKTNAMSKLSESIVAEIRKLHSIGDYNQRELGEKFGVSHRTISSLILRRTWKHVQ